MLLPNGTWVPVNSTVTLPPGNNPLMYKIVDSAGYTATSPATYTVNGLPTIQAPALPAVNATSPAGAEVTIPPPASSFCGIPQCTITVVLPNGTEVPVNSTVTLPPGNNLLTYTIKDNAGNTATSPATYTVNGIPTIQAPADATIRPTSLTGAPYTIPMPNATCPQPQCTYTVTVNGQVYKPGDVVQLPVGSTPLQYTVKGMRFCFAGSIVARMTPCLTTYVRRLA